VAQLVAGWTQVAAGNFDQNGFYSADIPVTADPDRCYVVVSP
jgi:hypothetical protein